VVSGGGVSDGVVMFWLFFGFVAIAITAITWRFHRGQTLLRRWAASSGYRLHDHEVRWLVRGPFFWTTSKAQMVYRVTVEDNTGHLRRGWVRCGSWLGGLLSDRVDVRWDDGGVYQPGFPVITKDMRDP
jgi:hypothetical protein